MRKQIDEIVTNAIKAAINAGELNLNQIPDSAVERPADPTHGDWACTIALKLAKELKRSPRDIANAIAIYIQQDSMIAQVEVAGPGFINMRLSNAALQQVIKDAFDKGARFAQDDDGAGRTVNVEFISANPTGPMHVGHGRWAATGNALCNVLQHAGWNVTREFYINDAGHQMDVFGHSVGIRYLELCGENIEHPDEFYGGAYVIDIARAVLRDKGDSLQHASESERDGYCREFGYDMMLGNIRSLCKRIGCGFDTWFSERTLYVKDAESGYSPIDSVLQALDTQDYLYEKEGATWLRTTDFGDDKDRVLIKTDGTYTYFLPDIAYHNSKIARGDASVIANSENATAAQAATTQTAPAQGTKLIDIWGADHHGYIKRMQSAMQALGHTGEPTVVLGQLVNLFRNGEPVRMSKRTGEMVTFEELVDEVGTDATLYLLLTRSTDQPIDFDIEAAKKQDATNPVYYVQYAHARICSILRKSQTDIAPDANLALLTDPAELDLAREMARLQDVVAECAQDLAPFHLTHYAQDLATAFHHFYTQCRVISDDAKLTAARLYLCAATKSVLALTLNLLGVSAPESM